MLNIQRPILIQPFNTFVVSVLTTATPIDLAGDKQQLITSFAVSLDAAAANNVFIGGPSVSLTNGLEIVRGGGPVLFRIVNERQLYELQEPLLDTQETLQCKSNVPAIIPLVVWDLSQVYLIAVANTSVRVAPFPEQFV